MKKWIALFLTVFMLFSLSCPAFAAQAPGNTVSPQWNYIDSITISLVFEDNVGYVDVGITYYYGITTGLAATLTIYKMVGIDWVYVDSMTKSDTSTFGFTKEFPAESGVMYKAVLDVTGYGPNGQSETFSTKEIDTCP